MPAFDSTQLWTIGIGCIVFGGLLIGLSVYILAWHVDWAAIKEQRAKVKRTHRDAEQGG